jgi:BirA family biotin operon repressor/biotin-[acetyl-CoA-carboxylase] ligase
VPEPQASPTRFAEVRWLAETDSTNRYLLDEARSGAPDGLVVVTDHQSAGRGRLGRAWTAPPGASLLVSVLLRPDLTPDDRHLVVMAAAVAMAEAVEERTGVTTALKWPNDILAGERKLAGILAEAAGDAVVVGIGVNVDWPVVPAELEGVATACNLEGGRPTSREDLLAAFLGRYERRLADLDETRRAYRARLATLGRTVRVERAGDTLVGTAVEIDPRGALVIDVGGERRTVTAGDVVHLRDFSES